MDETHTSRATRIINAQLRRASHPPIRIMVVTFLFKAICDRRFATCAICLSAILFGGCGDSKERNKLTQESKVEVDGKADGKNECLKLFRSELQATQVKYSSANQIALPAIASALETGDASSGPAMVKVLLWGLYDGDRFIDGSRAPEIRAAKTNATEALFHLTNAETQFGLVYTQFKTLPTSTKDDFLKLKQLLTKTTDFIEAARVGVCSRADFNQWRQVDVETGELFNSISLEIKRLETP